jgi:hypothetical protein
LVVDTVMRSSISLVIIVSIFKGEGKLCRACLGLFFFCKGDDENKRRKHSKIKKGKRKKKQGEDENIENKRKKKEKN